MSLEHIGKYTEEVLESVVRVWEKDNVNKSFQWKINHHVFTVTKVFKRSGEWCVQYKDNHDIFYIKSMSSFLNDFERLEP